jgi:hypothetical protein
MSLLAMVEVQLVLRCLDFRRRLVAARCNKQLYAAASHPFAWPQEQMATLRVSNDAAVLQSLGGRVRGSLLRSSSIHLRMQLRFPRGSGALDYYPHVFAVPNVQGITVGEEVHHSVGPVPSLEFLCHPDAQQLRVLDVTGLRFYRRPSLELLPLHSFRHLHSLSLGFVAAAIDQFATLQPLSLLPSLTHLTIDMEHHQARLLPSLPLCTRLVSLELFASVICTEVVNCLTQLPLLQRLQLSYSDMKEQSADAWAALHSLHEVQVDHVRESPLLMPLLSSVPILRLLRWHCGAPEYFLNQHDPYWPTMHSLRPLLTDAPLLQVELVMHSTFDEWQRASSTYAVVNALANYQRRKWDELHQIRAQLPRVRTVEPDEKNEAH